MNVFDFAMKMEQDGETYYRELAAKCKIDGLKRILLMLADDEVVHYNVFKKMKEENQADIQSSEVLKNAKNIFMDMKDKDEELEFNESEIEFYRKAIEIEKKSEDFYREKANETEDSQIKQILLKIADDEKKHQFLLKNTTDFLSRPQSWVENAEFHHLDEY